MFYLREYEHVSDPKFIANLFMQGWGEERTIPHPNIYYRTFFRGASFFFYEKYLAIY